MCRRTGKGEIVGEKLKRGSRSREEIESSGVALEVGFGLIISVAGRDTEVVALHIIELIHKRGANSKSEESH